MKKNIAISGILDYCLAINDTDKAQAFFSYSPHTDQVTVSVCEPIWEEDKDNYIFIDNVFMSGELSKVGEINNLVKKLVELIKKYEKLNQSQAPSPKEKKLEKSKTAGRRVSNLRNLERLSLSNHDKGN